MYAIKSRWVQSIYRLRKLTNWNQPTNQPQFCWFGSVGSIFDETLLTLSAYKVSCSNLVEEESFQNEDLVLLWNRLWKLQIVKKIKLFQLIKCYTKNIYLCTLGANFEKKNEDEFVYIHSPGVKDPKSCGICIFLRSNRFCQRLDLWWMCWLVWFGSLRRWILNCFVECVCQLGADRNSLAHGRDTPMPNSKFDCVSKI